MSAKITAPGVATVRLSRAFMRRAQAPGVLIAKSDGARLLGLTTHTVTARITRQATDATWLEWEVKAL